MAFGADNIGNPHVANQSTAEWFNVAAYTDPQAPYRDGTASADSLWGPAQYVFNLALEKTFRITEQQDAGVPLGELQRFQL